MSRSAFADAWRLAGIALACALPGSAGLAHPAVSEEHLFVPSPLQQREALFQSVAWKLAQTNAPYCANTWALIGLHLGAGAVPDRPLFVLSVAPQSPAQRAGLLPGEAILAIKGMDRLLEPALGENGSEALERIHRDIETLLEKDGKVTLEYKGASGERKVTTISAQPVCPSRFLTRDGKKIGADGVSVRFGLDFPGFDYPEDEFAAAIAHEFAHNLMGHPYWLDDAGRSRSNVRMTEREADRLMPWLLANAGYDPAAAQRFMERWGPRHGGGLLRKRTHDGWDERAEFIAAEVALIQQLREQQGAADWQTHFRREEGLIEASP